MKVIDVFSGVGGISLGGARAGFDIAAAIEIDKYAIESHGINFPNTIHIAKDVSKLRSEEVLTDTGLRQDQVAGIVGGPPCQGFSTIGKRNENDERSQLFTHFHRLVSEIKPMFYFAENVPGILNPKFSESIFKAQSLVKKDYDILEPVTIKASDFGAPTIRKRVFFLGFHKDLRVDVDELLNSIYKSKVETPVYVQEALRGLPGYINPRWQMEEQGWRKINYYTKTPFIDKALNQIPNGVGSKTAIYKLKKERLASGSLGTIHKEEIIERYRQLSPGMVDRISRSVKLDLKGFCPTLRAGTASDKGSYQAVRPIHPRQPRVITPREAARLQGFPDWFQFHSTKWHSFRQIGNSVSPIVSELILSKIYDALYS